MLQRRTILLLAIAPAVAGTLPAARAQRPSQPIARPPGQRAAGALVAGRFHPGGVASGALPGIYVVVAVDTGADTLQLRDADGRTGAVSVSSTVFDLATLQPGDEVEVDFRVPDPGSNKLEAGGLWKVQR